MESVIESRDLSWGKRIWYGLGGFFGNNIMLNIIAYVSGFIGGFIGAAVGSEAVMYAVMLLCMGAGVIIWVRWFFTSRKHESTQTGIVVSCAFQALVFFGTLLQGL